MFIQSPPSRNTIKRTPSEGAFLSRHSKDGLLLNTLHRNKYSHFDIKQGQAYNCILTSLKEYDKANQPTAATYLMKKEENDAFQHQYSMIKKINNYFRKKNRRAGRLMKLANFNEIITQYHQKGVKIPKLPTEMNNLFKSDPLLNTKPKKLKINLSYNEKDINKGLAYLKKLKEIIALFLSTDNEGIHQYFSKNDKKFYGDMLLFASLKEEQMRKSQIETECIVKDSEVLLELIRKAYQSPQPYNRKMKYHRSNSTFPYQSEDFQFISRQKRDSSTINSRDSPERKVVQFKPIALEEYKNALESNVALKRKSISHMRIMKKPGLLNGFNKSQPEVVPSYLQSYQDEKEYLLMAYHLLLSRGFDNVKPILKVLLKKFKKCTDSDIQRVLTTKDPNANHLFNYFSNLQAKVAKRNLPERIKRIYLETRQGTEITPKIEQMTLAEEEIKQLNNKLMSKVTQMN